jgi:competence protein ComEC
VHAFGAGVVLVATAGMLLVAIPISKLRLAGIPLLALALVLASTAPRPDVLIDASGTVVAVRGADVRLSILDARRGRLAAESWLAADADGRKASDDLAAGFACNGARCIARLADGATVVVARRYEALREECRGASLVVTRLFAPSDCRAPVIDQRTLATTGAVALRRVDSKWIAESARSPFEDRPWFGRATAPDAAALSRIEGTVAVKRASDRSRVDAGDVPTPEVPEEDGEE